MRMPDRCLSCGELAVIEDDEAGVTQRICIECGTVATGVRAKGLPDDKEWSQDVFNVGVDESEQVCESCGDSLPSYTTPGAKLCSECEELEGKNIGNEEPSTSTAQACDEENRNGTESCQSAKRCTSCGSTHLDHDSIGGDERLVCLDCGTVAGGETLTSDGYENMTGSNSFSTLPRFARRPQKLLGQTAGHDKISSLHNKFCFPDEIKSEAEEMFDKAFSLPQFLHSYITTKEHLAAACLFIVCRIHDIPVSYKHFKSHVDRFSVFLRVKKIVLRCMNISLPHMTLHTQVGQLLINRKFTPKLITKVQDILFLCSRAWLTQGRPREALIVMAAYYAYCSSDVCEGIMKIPQFASRFNFDKPPRSLQAEFNKIFVKLASHIPWVPSKNVKTSTVHKYVDDVLKYQNSLFQLAFRSEDMTALSGQKTDAKDNIHGALNLVNSEKYQDFAGIERKNGCRHKEVLLPSSLKKPRIDTPYTEVKISPHIDLDNPDVTAAEFDDEEITSYLLTPEEESRLRGPKLRAMNS